jgi:hypothetical protein
MANKTFPKSIWLVLALSLILVMSCTDAFAWTRGRSYQAVRVGHARYNYRDGRFYRPGWFGFQFSIGSAPIGAIITTLPFGHRSVIVGNTPYYYYDNVYYRACPSGYTVVPAPVVTYAPTVVQSPASDRETVIVNVPTSNGGSMAITLVRYSNGYVGPQGEFYSDLPTARQLRDRYGR